jgi:ERCC4-type nuclease
MVIERKSISDLLASIKDGRYEEQSYRLMHSSGFPPHSILYIIEGSMSQLRTLLEKKIVYSALTSLNFFKGFSVIRTNNVLETAEYIIWMSEKIEKNFLKCVFPYYLQPQFCKYMQKPVVTIEPYIVDAENEENNETPPFDSLTKLPVTISNDVMEHTNSNVQMYNVGEPYQLSSNMDQMAVDVSNSNYCSVVKRVKKDNITPDNIGEIILCQIPGISFVTALAIMKRFSTFPNLIKELQSNPTCLDNISYETNGKIRKINRPSIDNIKKFLL